MIVKKKTAASAKTACPPFDSERRAVRTSDPTDGAGSESSVGASDHTGHRAKRVGFYGRGVAGVLRGLWPLWSAATMGQRSLRIGGHYGSAVTTGRRSLRVSSHYGSAATTEDSLLPSPIGYSLLPISRAVGVWYAPGRRGEQSVAGYGVVWISQRISRPSSSLQLTVQPFGEESSSVLLSMRSSPKISPLVLIVMT